MPTPLSAAAGSTVLAHPVSGHPHVEVPTLLLTVAAGLLVAMVLPVVPAGRTRGYDAARAASWAGPLSRGQQVVRAVAVVVLVLAVLTGLFGTRDELDNLAPALVVGTAWPVLTVLALVSGHAERMGLVLRVMVAGLGCGLMFGYPVQDPAIAVTVATLVAAVARQQRSR